MQKLSNGSPVFVVIWIISQDIFLLLRKGHYQWILARSWGALSLIGNHSNWVSGVLPFPYWECSHSSDYSGTLCVLQSCLLYSLLSISIPCIYEKILSPILLYILKPTKQRQLSPSDIFLFKFILNLTQNWNSAVRPWRFSLAVLRKFRENMQLRLFIYLARDFFWMINAFQFMINNG